MDDTLCQVCNTCLIRKQIFCHGDIFENSIFNGQQGMIISIAVSLDQGVKVGLQALNHRA